MEILLIALVLGCIPGAIAQSKGRSFVGWWLYGAALFVIALPHSLLLERHSAPGNMRQPSPPPPSPPPQAPRPRGTISTPTPAPQPPTLKTCPDCAEQVQAAARICRFCRYEFPTEPDAEPKQPPASRTRHTPFGMKPCPSCGKSNWHDAAQCSDCGTTFALATPKKPTAS